ncbi:hypothetical protein M409DRAFT_71496 [Zasmidium cellare ATCC 36951]|uniref:Major facilitator superfamily (MFS) profile domain-containing protein n=1 Tax=Zasmidium cellare ATCC 36951 TaxID=1080233 RepID=A0A6A6BV76_ZASCE|nr:uncharacterized protein M409DRAFT_71496 [Zasmidium cellare ATCC 36951]KAF2158704.1 hypothetical protein M409DRAFT_71496 [Zasmidium cellare ATCC 36951]
MAHFTTQVGLGQLLAIVQIIGADFDITSPGILSWLSAGYSLTVGTFILISGRMGDIFGYKNMLVIGYAWYAVFTLVAGCSVYSNYVLFIFARVLQGIGPSICLPNALALLGILFEPGMGKNMAFAAFGACAPTGSIMGSIFAGVFALAWWPWTFWSFAMVLVAHAVVTALTIPDTQVRTIQPRSLVDYMNHLDLYAATIGITAMILFNFAWNQAPVVGWDSPYVLVCLILAVLLFPAFLYLELRVSKFPLIPWSVFNRDNGFVLACIAMGWASFGIWVYYIWQIFLVSRGVSPILGAAYLTPMIISGIVAAGSTGLLLGIVRPAWLMVFSLSAFLASAVLTATLPPHQIYWAQIFVCTLVATFGMEMSFPAATVYLSNSIEREHQGVAASLVSTIVNYSISLGLGFAGTVEVNVRHGDSPKEILQGYRGALYIAVGFAGMGLATSVVFLAHTYWGSRRGSKVEASE